MLSEAPGTVAGLLTEAGWDKRLSLTVQERQRLAQGHALVSDAAADQPVYGVNRGFGPLAEYLAGQDVHQQGVDLIHHLTAGQGPPLSPEVTRLMVWLRLRGMALGHSGVPPEVWELLAAQWNAGFTPVVPCDGSLSASGDLVPLAHAAETAAGDGEVWTHTDPGWQREPAAEVLRRLNLAPVRWEARSALAFVNGTSASLARAVDNQVRLEALARAAAAATGRLAALLGCGGEAFREELAAVRGHAGHQQAAELVRRQLPDPAPRGDDRPLQESYSLRCAPQVIGAVLDQLRLQQEVLVTEAGGCTDNPVVVAGRVHHGGNFHAAPIALVNEQHSVCVHQLAYLLERQLAMAMDPRRNGGLPPLLASVPGSGSGLAGVQIAASSHLAAIRQEAYPASCTPVPSNLDNQDHVPMALNGANAVADMLKRTWWIAASVCHGLTQLARLQSRPVEIEPWQELAAQTPDLTTDRPMATAVAALALRLERLFTRCPAAGLSESTSAWPPATPAGPSSTSPSSGQRT